MAITDYIIHGHDPAVPLLLDHDIDENLEGLDTGTLRYLAADKNYFTKGAAVPDEEFAGLYVKGIKRRPDGPHWQLDLAVEGVAGPKAERHLVGSPDPHYSATDWDTVNINMLTTNVARYVSGQVVPGFGIAMVCMESNPKPLAGYSNWYHLQARLQGIAKQKPTTREITVNGQTISGDAVIWPITGGGTNWVGAKPATVELPRVVVTDTFFSTSPPPTGVVPGSRVPPNAPTIKAFNIVFSPAHYYWPNGWKFMPQADQLLDRTIYRHRWTYEWVWPALPAGS